VDPKINFLGEQKFMSMIFLLSVLINIFIFLDPYLLS